MIIENEDDKSEIMP